MKKKLSVQVFAAVLIAGTSLISTGVFAQQPPIVTAAQAGTEIPVETLFKKSDRRSPTYSPDQKTVVVLSQVNGRINMVAIDLEKRTAIPLTAYSEADVSYFFWASNTRLIYGTGDQQGLEFRGDGGLFAIDKDGKNARTLVEPYVSKSGIKIVARTTKVVGRIKDNEDEVIVSANDRVERSQDLYRLNIRTGRKSLITLTSPGQVEEWTLDSDNVPRGVLTQDTDKLEWQFAYRTTETSPWKTMAKWDYHLKDVIIPYMFDPTDKSKMYVLSNVGRDTLAFFHFDPETGKLGELVYGDDRYDMGTFHLIGEALGEGGDLIFAGKDEDPGKLIGVRYNADKPRIIWFDEAARKAQAAVDAALPDTVNRFNPNQRRTLVRASSDVEPGSYYFFDQDKRTLEDTGIRRLSWIDPKQMAHMTPVSWTARDGLRIDGYLTLPLNYVKGRPVPLVLHPHGGPWAKDNWGYDPEVQFMANRGFAVLQPNFRGSTGYGAKHLTSSYKQWGDTMIDDMIDGVEWAIKEGYADKNRIGVYGASYGGYATLMAMEKRPDLFKWGVNYVGVTDMELHQDSQPAQKYGFFGPLAKVINGDQRADKEMFARTSPARHVDRIAAPVFHAYGGEDYNVDFTNGTTIRSAFDSAKKPYIWMFEGEEGHGYRTDEHVFAFYNQFDKFIKANTPPAAP